MSIEVRGLSSAIPKLNVNSLTIEMGRTYILLGPNGSGKTTLLKALIGLIDTQADRHEVNGEPLKELSLAQRSNLFGYCPQTLRAHPDLNCELFLANAMVGNGKPPSLRLNAARAALDNHHLCHLATRPLAVLSGGEWQRLILLSLELKNAPYWLLDEPTNHLDPANQIETLRLLAKESQTKQRAIILASHELSLLGLLHNAGDLPPPTLILMNDGGIQEITTLNSSNLSVSLSKLFKVNICAAPDELGRTFLYPGREVSHD